MHTLTATGKLTKNLIATAQAWLILVEIDATGVGGSTYRRTSDESTTFWNGLIFNPAALSFGEVRESVQGDLPKVSLTLPNTDTALNTAMNNYDGLRGAAVTVYIVPSGNLAVSVAELTETFEVVETSADNQWITFTLGFSDPLGKRFPRDRYTAAICRHVFKGIFCRYVGVETTCDHTLAHCQARGNTPQYGGSPGVDEGVYN